MGVVMDFKVGDRVTLTCDVPVRMMSRQLMLRKGDSGTVVSDDDNHFHIVRFDSCGYDVLIAANQIVHAVDELASLRAQLAARDAALDAVLALASDNSTISESDETRMFRERVLLRLANHGVHPK
jgi:hypothetical protein